LACFVGMSLGCLVARRRTNFIRHTPCWLLVGILAGLVIDLNSDFLRKMFAVGNQASPDVVYFGTETGIAGKVPMELVGGLFFAIIAAIMVGPGQEMGRAFNRVPSRTTAYSANLLGSLVGIGMFAGCSFLRLPPIVWFGLSGLVLAYLLVRKDPDAGSEVRDALPPSVTGATATASPHPAPSPKPTTKPVLPLVLLLAAVALTVVTSGFFVVRGRHTNWSEYYRVDYIPAGVIDSRHRIETNLISQQLIEPQTEAPTVTVPYALPYLFQRDVKNPDGTQAWQPFKKILIIGAGNGNDVARARMWAPDAEIDAVEIDPVIQATGAAHHPDGPFANKQLVKVTINDGRNFLREAKPETYDLVIFALIDSLVLQSGYSNLRLESYLFTRECFQDARRVLKPTGVFAVYNFFRQPWIAVRIREQLRLAFGVDPVVINCPDETGKPVRIDTPEDEYNPNMSTGFFSGSEQVVYSLRRMFEPQNGQKVSYWYPWLTHVPADTKAAFGPTPPKELPARSHVPFVYQGQTHEPEWLALYPAEVEDSNGTLRLADDDWPFLYTRKSQIPRQTWVSIALILILSIGLWLLFGGVQALKAESGVKPDYGMMLRAFFLGAGFMLVETKAVTQMALLFGGTWMVNTAVFAAILVMSLAGNLFAGWIRPKRLEPYYAGLFGALALGLVVSPSAFLGFSPTVQIVGACLIVFAPIAFAGVIFATSFRRTSQPDRVFGANVAGALVGGLAENTSVVLGFQLLLCVAFGFYLLSAVFANKELPGSAADQSV
jgi:SAM-dependent methyltransferase